MEIQHLGLVVFLRPILNHFCSVAWCIILLPVQQYVGNGTCQSNIHLHGMTQGFPHNKKGSGFDS